MTVKQLRDQLQLAHPDAPVLIVTQGHGYCLARVDLAYADRSPEGHYSEDLGKAERTPGSKSVPALIIS